VVAHRGTLEEVDELGGSLDVEPEVVTQLDLLRRNEIVGGRPLSVPAAEIHIPGGPEAGAEAEVECDRALENPSVRRHNQQSCEQPVECDELPEQRQRNSFVPRRRQKALL
jgi:hypothetical protein